MVVSGFYKIYGVRVTEKERAELFKNNWAQSDVARQGEDFIPPAQDPRCFLVQMPEGFELEEDWVFGVGEHVYFGSVEENCVDSEGDNSSASLHIGEKIILLDYLINNQEGTKVATFNHTDITRIKELFDGRDENENEMHLMINCRRFDLNEKDIQDIIETGEYKFDDPPPIVYTYRNYNCSQLFDVIDRDIGFTNEPTNWYIPNDCPCCS